MNSFQPPPQNLLNLSSSLCTHMHALPPHCPPPFPPSFSEEGDMQALANLKGF